MVRQFTQQRPLRGETVRTTKAAAWGGSPHNRLCRALSHRATVVVMCTVSPRNCRCCVHCLTTQSPLLCVLSHHTTIFVVCVHCPTMQPPLLCALSHHATAFVVCTLSPCNRLCCLHCLTTLPPLLCAPSHHVTAFVVCVVSPHDCRCCVCVCQLPFFMQTVQASGSSLGIVLASLDAFACSPCLVSACRLR